MVKRWPDKDAMVGPNAVIGWVGHVSSYHLGSLLDAVELTVECAFASLACLFGGMYLIVYRE